MDNENGGKRLGTFPAKRKLITEAGAELLCREDRFGETKSGWWLDGQYLGNTIAIAYEAITG